jgi:hypothetical protein
MEQVTMASGYEGETLSLPHVNYPHEPGRLYDCPGCESECHCSEVKRLQGETQCIFCASLEAQFTDADFLDTDH